MEVITISNVFVSFDVIDQTIKINEDIHELSSTEFRIALFLFVNRPKAFSMKELLDRFNLSGNLNLMRVHVTRIRQKTSDEIIDTPWGTGTIRWGNRFTEESMEEIKEEPK